MPGGDKILMYLIADAVKGCRCNAYKNQFLMVIFERQGLISPVKQAAQQGIGHKMQQLVEKAHLRHVFGSGEAGLDEYGQAGDDERQPANKENSKF